MILSIIFISSGCPTGRPPLDRVTNTQCDWHNAEGPALSCGFVLTCAIEMVARGHAAHTLAFCLPELTPHRHTSQRHTPTVSHHHPALTVLSHHIWAVLTCDATGQNTTCTRGSDCLSSPCIWVLCLVPLSHHVQI